MTQQELMENARRCRKILSEKAAAHREAAVQAAEEPTVERLEAALMAALALNRARLAYDAWLSAYRVPWDGVLARLATQIETQP